LITIKIERDKTRANFANLLVGPRLAIERASDERAREHLWTHIEQAAHQAALPLDDCHAPATLHSIPSAWLGVCPIHRLDDELFRVSSAALSRARETRCVENRQLMISTIPPPTLTPRCAGTSGDRPDLPADDWTAPSTTEPVTAAAIRSVAGSFTGAGAAIRSESIVRQEQKN
jgi:hypothetical protein